MLNYHYMMRAEDIAKELNCSKSHAYKIVKELNRKLAGQPVYRWFKGQNLPSVEKLCALSSLLGVHMEELLVLEGQSMNIGLYKVVRESRSKRLLYYAQYLQNIA